MDAAKKKVKELKQRGELNREAVISLFKKYRPTDEFSLKLWGLKIKSLDRGLFRSGVLIKLDDVYGNVVAKFPHCTEDIRHSLDELDNIKHIKKTAKYKPFRRYLPEILFSDTKTGVILMPEYEEYLYRLGSVISEMLSNLAIDIHGLGGDIHSSNVMKDIYDGHPVIIDLGYFRRT